MFSSYLKMKYRYPNIVHSFLEQGSRLIHSCHLVLEDMAGQSGTPDIWMTFVMLLTYTERGVRLSCSEFKTLKLLRYDSVQNNRVRGLVEEHFRVGIYS